MSNKFSIESNNINEPSQREKELQKELNDLRADFKAQQLQYLKKKSFFSDGLSINESRASALILAMIVILAIACLQMYFLQDVSDNIAGILKFALTAVAGASSTFAISNAIKSNNDDNNYKGA